MNARTTDAAPAKPIHRAALYLRVSTGRQAESDLSIPDQRRQANAYARAKGWQIAAEFVEPGQSATDDRRPEFQRLMDAASERPAPFDVVLVHSFSRFFRDQFQLEFYVRKLAKAGVRLMSITQELGDDSMGNMIRQIMALFDEYQSKENAKHTLRAMNENARQGFWNGALPPIGYRIVAAEQRGPKIKKKLEVDPIHAETVRLIYRLALQGHGDDGPMGLKAIATHLNERDIRTRDGGRWGLGAVHQILTRTSYKGEHRFNTRDHKTRRPKPEAEHAVMAVPPIVSETEWNRVQAQLRSRNPMNTPPRTVSGPTLLTGIAFCAACGGAMTLRTGKNGRYRYYTCSTRARQGDRGCGGATVPMDKLDEAVVSHLEDKLLEAGRLTSLLSEVLDHREAFIERRIKHVADLKKRATEAEAKVARLYEAIENGIADLADPKLKGRIAELNAIRDQARADAERAEGAIERAGPELTQDKVIAFADAARARLRNKDGSYRRAHVRAIAQRVEVLGKDEVRIVGMKTRLLQTIAADGVAPSAVEVLSIEPKWRTRQDSNL